MSLNTLSNSLRAASLLAAVQLAVGCVGSTPPGPGGNPGGPDAGGDPGGPDAGDPGQDPQAIRVNGTTMDYRESAPLASVSLSTAGVVDSRGLPISAVSDANGNFVFNDVPAASTFFVTASLDSQQLDYRPTRNEPTIVVDQTITDDVYLVSEAFVGVQTATVGLAVAPLTSMVIGDLRAPDGTPMQGIPLADITLTDALGNPVGAGPYFFGPLGDLDLAVQESTSYGGRARFAFLNVPSGVQTLTVQYPDPLNPDALIPMVTSLTSLDDSAYLLLIGQVGAGDPLPGNLTFTQDIYPRLQKASAGGDGCANCHTGTGVAAFLPYDVDPALVYQSIRNRPGLVDLLNPEQSLLLSKPMYEEPPNHPNATYLDALNPSYRAILLWISQGALQ